MAPLSSVFAGNLCWDDILLIHVCFANGFVLFFCVWTLICVEGIKGLMNLISFFKLLFFYRAGDKDRFKHFFFAYARIFLFIHRAAIFFCVRFCNCTAKIGYLKRPQLLGCGVALLVLIAGRVFFFWCSTARLVVLLYRVAVDRSYRTSYGSAPTTTDCLSCACFRRNVCYQSNCFTRGLRSVIACRWTRWIHVLFEVQYMVRQP